MIFGRQKNLVRRPVRPDGRFTRDIRRRSVGRASLLDLQGERRKSLLERVVLAMAGVFRKR